MTKHPDELKKGSVIYFVDHDDARRGFPIKACYVQENVNTGDDSVVLGSEKDMAHGKFFRMLDECHTDSYMALQERRKLLKRLENRVNYWINEVENELRKAKKP